MPETGKITVDELLTLARRAWTNRQENLGEVLSLAAYRLNHNRDVCDLDEFVVDYDTITSEIESIIRQQSAQVRDDINKALKFAGKKGF